MTFFEKEPTNSGVMAAHFETLGATLAAKDGKWRLYWPASGGVLYGTIGSVHDNSWVFYADNGKRFWLDGIADGRISKTKEIMVHPTLRD